MVTTGIDPHEASHTAAVVDGRSRALARLRERADEGSLERLLAWAATWSERTWAVEGTGGLGRLLAQQPVAAGERVVDVPSQLATRARLSDAGHGGRRPTPSTPPPWPPSTARACVGFGAEDHTAVLRPTAATSSPKSAAAASAACTGSCGTCWPAVRPATSTPTGPPPSCAGCGPPRSSTPSAR